ncbi:MAG: hypothetical protein PHC41_06835 [Lachnospiraceae bacterium]|nr:hypothetical protein [Lachnospiraceae bacterium]MDD3615928.1 hypothetical protein [Lachnospiraceae bacterium]
MISIVIFILTILIWGVVAIALFKVMIKHKNVITIILYVLFLIISISVILFVISCIFDNTLYDTPEAVYEDVYEDDKRIERVVEGDDSCMLFIVSEDAYGVQMVEKKDGKYGMFASWLPMYTREYRDSGDSVYLEIDNMKGSSDYYACLYVYGVKALDLDDVQSQFGNSQEIYHDSESDTDIYFYHLSEFPKEAIVEVNDQIVEWTSTKYSTAY